MAVTVVKACMISPGPAEERSVDDRAGRLDHARPFVRFGLEIARELAAAHRLGLRALARELRDGVFLAEYGRRVLVPPVEHRGRGARGREEPDPVQRFILRKARFGD